MLTHTLPSPPPGASAMAEAEAFGAAFALAVLAALAELGAATGVAATGATTALLAAGAAVAAGVAGAGLAGVAVVCANALPITKVVAMRVAINLFMVRPYSVYKHRQFLCTALTRVDLIALTFFT